ncbi:MAG: SOS-response repressor and protease LexA, partial [uncultured Solirubrobacteraceae bacterium]
GFRAQAHHTPAGDLRVHRLVLVGTRLSADGPRHRQGRRARLVLDGARPSRQPGEGRAAAPRSHQAAGHRAARSGGRRGEVGRAHAGAAADRACRRRSADPRRGEHRGLRGGASAGRRRGRRVRAARQRRVDEERRHPRWRLRGGAPAADRPRRRDRRRDGGGGGDGQALLPRGRSHPAGTGERDDGADPVSRRPGHRAGRRRLPERVM